MADRIVMKKAKSFEKCKPGQWAIASDGALFIICPHDHGYPAMLWSRGGGKKNWVIDKDGNVSPSVWIKNKDCDWHVFLTLRDWEPIS